MELFRILGTIAINNSDANRAIDETRTKAKSASEKIGSTFANIGQKSIDLGSKMKGMSVTAGLAFGGMIKSAANVKAQNAQFAASFGDLQAEAKKAFDNIAKDTGVLAGRLKTEGTKAFSQFKGAGLDAADALKKTDQFTRLAADGAAYYDMSLEETSELMRSFIRGNTEAGDRIGLFTSETQRNQRAVELLGKKYLDCTEAEKQMIMLDIASSIYETSGAMGQASREADGWENVMGNFMYSLMTFGATLGETVLPAVTRFVQKATDFVLKFQDMGEGTKKFIAILIGVTAAASPVLTVFGKMMTTFGKVITITSKLNTSFLRSVAAVKNYRDATKGASLAAGVMNGDLTKSQAVVGGLATKFGGMLASINPIVLGFAGVTAAAGALAIGIYKVYQNTHQETVAAKAMADEHEKSVEKINKQAETSELYAQKLDELSQKENKSAQDKELMQSYVDKLNGSVDGLNLKYDAEKDKLSQTTDEIYKKIDAMKEEALQAAYIKHSQEALDKYTESQIKLTEAQDNLKDSQKEWNSLSDSEKQVRGDLAKKIKEQETKVKDLTTATQTYWTEYTKQANQAKIASGEWDSLVKEAKAAGIKVPQSLTQGIKEGKYAIPTTVDELNALIEFDKAAQNATGDAQKTVQNLQQQLANGDITVQEAAKILSESISTELNKTPEKAKQAGDKSGKDMAKGLEGTKGLNSGAGKGLSNSAKTGASSVNGFSTVGSNKGSDIATGLQNTASKVKKAGEKAAKEGKTGANSVGGWYDSGYNMGSGIASGISGAAWLVKSAAEAAIEAAKKAANKKSKSASPSKLFRDEVGAYLGQGVAVGILNEIPTIEKASQKMIDAARPSLTSQGVGIDTNVQIRARQAIPAVEKPSTAVSGDEEVLIKILNTLQQIQETMNNQKIQWNDRELGRFVKNYA